MFLNSESRAQDCYFIAPYFVLYLVVSVLNFLICKYNTKVWITPDFVFITPSTMNMIAQIVRGAEAGRLKRSPNLLPFPASKIVYRLRRRSKGEGCIPPLSLQLGWTRPNMIILCPWKPWYSASNFCGKLGSDKSHENNLSMRPEPTAIIPYFARLIHLEGHL